MALDDAPPEHRNWEWQHLYNQLDGASSDYVPGGKGCIAGPEPVADRSPSAASSTMRFNLLDVVTASSMLFLRAAFGSATSVGIPA